ncbi:MAG TPA: hypothetical protein V6C52_05685 [Coleofasciculaceae cyanobacterium]
MHSTSGIRSPWAPQQPRTTQPLTFGKTWRPGQWKEERELRQRLSQEEKARVLNAERARVQTTLDDFKTKYEPNEISGYHLADLYSDNPAVRKHSDLLKPLIQEWVKTLNSPIEVAEALDEVHQRLKVPSMWNISLFAPLGGGPSWSEMFTPINSLKSLFRKENRCFLFIPQVFMQPLLARKRELEKQEI